MELTLTALSRATEPDVPDKVRLFSTFPAPVSTPQEPRVCSGWGAWVIGMISDRQPIWSGAKQRRRLLESEMHVLGSLKAVC